MWRTRTRRAWALFLAAPLAATLAACNALPLGRPTATFQDGTESMPGPASIWLFADPETLPIDIPVVMTVPGEPSVRFEHTFVANEPLRGDFLTSEGTYHLSALNGACTADLRLGSQQAEVVLALDEEGGCSMRIAWIGPYEDTSRDRPQDAVFITNHDAANATPRIEPAP